MKRNETEIQVERFNNSLLVALYNKQNKSNSVPLQGLGVLLFLLILFFSYSFAGNIVVGTKTYPVDTLAHFKIGPGSYYTALNLIDATKPLRVFFLEVDATNPYISFKSVLGKDSTVTCERPSDMAKRKTKAGAMYFGGTNGDFFSTTAPVGIPVAGSMVEGEIGRIPNTRPDIAFDRNIAPFIGTKVYAGNVSIGGNTFSIANINTTRSTNQLILYNSLNGKFTHTNSFGTEVLVQLIDPKWDVNKTLKAKVISVVSGVGNMAIPQGSAVLSGHGTAQTYLNTLNVNDEIDINLGITIGGSEKPSLTDMVGGDRPILQDGLVTDNDWVELNPRTAMGFSADKSKIYFCVVDGRSLLSIGVGTKQLADIMKSAGAYTAINLDGGGSSCMYVKEFNVMNVGSDGVERAVGNGIFAVSSAPTDAAISEISSYEKTIELPRYGVFKPQFLGYNQYGTLLNTNVQGVTLTCPPEVGYINGNGQLVASGTQNGVLTATFNGIQTKVNIVLRDEAEIAIRLDSVLIDNRFEYPIEVQSVIGQNTMQVLPSALTWTVLQPEICSVVNGNLIGMKNGTSLVIGNLGSFKDTLLVRVEIPTAPRMVQDDFSNIASWTMTSPSSTWNATMTSEVLPVGWTHGTAIRYVYKSARAPSIKMAKVMRLYSLPDTIKFVINPGDVDINKLILGFHINNQTQSLTSNFTVVPKNTDSEFSIPTSSIVSTVSDIASYPVWFDYFSIYINTATQFADATYNIYLKEIALCYKNIVLGLTNPELLSNLRVYPNPVFGNELSIALKNISLEPIRIQLYNVVGQLIRSENLGIQLTREVNFPVNQLQSGTYFLSIYQGKKVDTIKFIKR